MIKERWGREKAEKEGGSEVREFKRLGVIAGASRGCSDQSEGGHGSLHQARRAEVLTLKRQILCFWHSVAFSASPLSYGMIPQ